MNEEEHEELDSKEWPTWKCAALTGALCAVPLLLPLLVFPLPTIAAWITLVLLYLGTIKMWGTGFVIHGAILVIILSLFFLILFPRIFDKERVSKSTSVSIREAFYAGPDIPSDTARRECAAEFCSCLRACARNTNQMAL